jgi:hypothetical protein
MTNFASRVITAILALCPAFVIGVELSAPRDPAATEFRTPIDNAIDAALKHRLGAKRLTPSDSALARQQLQLQYLSLSPEAKREVVAVTQIFPGDAGAMRAVQLISNFVEQAARDQVANVNAAVQATQPQAQGAKPKLGVSSPDLVFVPTVGPCRVARTASGINNVWPGPIGPVEARQIWAYSDHAGYDFASEQGGVGTAGTGNCSGTVFIGSVTPNSVVATITVLNTTSTGRLRAWNGDPNLTVGTVLAWNAGETLANTAVIPLGRFAAQYPNSGPVKRDFAVYNSSTTPIDIIVDVVGYMISSSATALDCYTVNGSATSIGTGFRTLPGPACTTGYTAVLALPFTALSGVYVAAFDAAGTVGLCAFNNETFTTSAAICDTRCCRVPGR